MADLMDSVAEFLYECALEDIKLRLDCLVADCQEFGVESMDVRLQVLPNREDPSQTVFRVWSGLPCYDTDHSGHWGASTVTRNGFEDISEVAIDLIEQCLDRMY